MLFWGSGGAFVRSLALAVEPQNALAIRYALLTVINVGGLALFGSRIERRDWPRLLFASIAGTAAFNMFTNYGLALVPAGIAGIIGSTEPLIIAVGAFVFLNEGLSPLVLIGMAIAIAGSALLFWAGTSSGSYSLIGVILVFLSCVSWATYTIACKPLLSRYDPFSVTAWTMVIAAPVVILNGAAGALHAASLLGWREWAEVLYLIIPYAVVGTVLWNFGASRLSGAATGAYLYLIPIIAVASGTVVLGEAVTPQVVLGGLIILSGVAIAEFGPELLPKRAS
jgi:drug/metabolite transporter (DMT)-like permease